MAWSARWLALKGGLPLTSRAESRGALVVGYGGRTWTLTMRRHTAWAGTWPSACSVPTPGTLTRMASLIRASSVSASRSRSKIAPTLFLSLAREEELLTLRPASHALTRPKQPSMVAKCLREQPLGKVYCDECEDILLSFRGLLAD